MPLVEDRAGRGCPYRWCLLHGHRRLKNVAPGRPYAARTRQNLRGSRRTFSSVRRSRIPRRRPSPITDCDFAFRGSRPGSTRLSSVIVPRVVGAPWSSTRASRGICCECTPSKIRSLPKESRALTRPGSSRLLPWWRRSQEARCFCADAERKAENSHFGSGHRAGQPAPPGGIDLASAGCVPRTARRLARRASNVPSSSGRASRRRRSRPRSHPLRRTPAR